MLARLAGCDELVVVLGAGSKLEGSKVRTIYKVFAAFFYVRSVARDAKYAYT